LKVDRWDKGDKRGRVRTNAHFVACRIVEWRATPSSISLSFSAACRRYYFLKLMPMRPSRLSTHKGERRHAAHSVSTQMWKATCRDGFDAGALSQLSAKRWAGRKMGA